MSARKLGGGRVLGSGKGLTPAAAGYPQRTSSLLSPSASTISVNSTASTSQLSTDAQDLSSRVSLDQRDETNNAAADSRLACPICDEEMVRMLQDVMVPYPVDALIGDAATTQQVTLKISWPLPVLMAVQTPRRRAQEFRGG